LGCGPYRLADTDEQQRNGSGSGNARPARRREVADHGSAVGLGNHHHQGLEGQRSGHQAEGGRLGAVRSITEAGEPRGLADAEHDDRRPNEQGRRPEGRALDGRRGSARGLADAMPAGRPEGWTGAGNGQASRHDSDCGPRPTNGHWRDADWLHCRDGKWRPVEPGTFPLAHGAPARVGRLRAYGNAIVPQAAAEVIAAYMEIREQIAA
jgi:DNA (cytosine-5)-methyltransferase 1